MLKGVGGGAGRSYSKVLFCISQKLLKNFIVLEIVFFVTFIVSENILQNYNFYFF